MTDLTDAHRRALASTPIAGLTPGSNYWPFVDLTGIDGQHVCEGEDIEFLARAGLLAATPHPNPHIAIKGGSAGPYGDIPDIEVTHRYVLTDAGREALSTPDTARKREGSV